MFFFERGWFQLFLFTDFICTLRLFNYSFCSFGWHFTCSVTYLLRVLLFRFSDYLYTSLQDGVFIVLYTIYFSSSYKGTESNSFFQYYFTFWIKWGLSSPFTLSVRPLMEPSWWAIRTLVGRWTFGWDLDCGVFVSGYYHIPVPFLTRSATTNIVVSELGCYHGQWPRHS